MSRRRRRHYRGMGSLVRFPGLGSLTSAVPRSVNTTDVVVGVGVGMAGAALLKIGAEKMNIALPAFVSASPLAGAAATGLLMYALGKRKNRARAASHAVGAALGGLIVWGYGQLQASGLPGFSDLRTMPGGYGAPIFNNPRLMGFNGPIFDNPRQALNQFKLARLQGLGDENEDGMFPAP